MEKQYSYEDFLNIIKTLRGEGGCPWDREQTHESLKANLIEECYELVEAIDCQDQKLMQEELGDVLLQVVMHAQIAAEAGDFTMADVVSGIAAKMVHRHPHVFKEEAEALNALNLDLSVTSSAQVLKNWDQIKTQEKQEKSVADGMERVAKTLPALMRTQKVQKKACKAQGETYDLNQQIDTIISALNGLKCKDLQEETAEQEEKIGKLMFEVVKLSTFFDINAEFALTKSLEKFINRFRYIENSRFAED